MSSAGILLMLVSLAAPTAERPVRPAFRPDERFILEVETPLPHPAGPERTTEHRTFELHFRERDGRALVVLRDTQGGYAEVDAPPGELLRDVTGRGPCASAPGLAPAAGFLAGLRTVAEALDGDPACWTGEPLKPGDRCGAFTVEGTCTGEVDWGLLARAGPEIAGPGRELELCVAQGKRLPARVTLRAAGEVVQVTRARPARPAAQPLVARAAATALYWEASKMHGFAFFVAGDRVLRAKLQPHWATPCLDGRELPHFWDGEGLLFPETDVRGACGMRAGPELRYALGGGFWGALPGQRGELGLARLQDERPPQCPDQDPSLPHSPPERVCGTVTKTIEKSDRTFLRLRTDHGYAWAQVEPARVSAGEAVCVTDAFLAENGPTPFTTRATFFWVHIGKLERASAKPAAPH